MRSSLQLNEWLEIRLCFARQLIKIDLVGDNPRSVYSKGNTRLKGTICSKEGEGELYFFVSAAYVTV